MSRSIEYCFTCNDATGNAGKEEDSLYIDDIGPYCQDCYDEIVDNIHEQDNI